MPGAQGHVRIGPETVTDPAFLVTRNMEDFVTWVDTSKIKRKVQKFNEVRFVLEGNNIKMCTRLHHTCHEPFSDV